MKLKTILISAVIAVSFIISPVALAAKSETKSLVDAIVATSEGGYEITENHTTSVNLNSQKLITGTIKSEAKKFKDDLEAHIDVKATFDTAAISKLESDILSASGQATMGEDLYFEKSTNSFLFQIRDLSLKFDEKTDKDVKVIGEGFFELAKFAQNKYKYDLNELISVMEDMNGELDLPPNFGKTLSDIYQNPSKVQADLIGALLDSGFLNVTKKSNTYVITLEKNLKQVNVTPLIENFGKMTGMSEAEIQSKVKLAKEDIKNDFDEIKQGWQEVVNAVDLQLIINTSSGRISGVTMNLNLLIDKDGIKLEGKWTSSANIESAKTRVKIPASIRNGINFTKFLRATVKMEELDRARRQKMMREWEQENSDY